MKKSFFLSVGMLSVFYVSVAQNAKLQQDRNAIKAMCGCHEVKFNFKETFNYAKDSTYKPSKEKHDAGLEWITLVEDQSNKIVLQHLLITGNKESDIVKHWRQDWLFENRNLYVFEKEQSWKFQNLNASDVKGQWTQKVYQVDDSPRYEGTATWIHADGKSYWKNTTDAPLPRREHTIRKDYNFLNRRNIQEITPFGWIHEQDNKKIVRVDNTKDVILAEEKGMDVYTKVADEKCVLAQNYWTKNYAMWKKVRDRWEMIFAKNKDLNLKKTVDEKPLFVHLFELKPDAEKIAVNKIIDGFVN